MRVGTHWWGINVRLSKSETCFLLFNLDTASEIASYIGKWGPIIAVAILIHKYWIQSKLGTNGVNLKISWTGNLFAVVRKGDPTRC